MSGQDGFISAVKLHIGIQQLRQQLTQRQKAIQTRDIAPPVANEPLVGSSMTSLLCKIDRAFAKEAKAARFWRKVDPSQVRPKSDLHFPRCQCLQICGDSLNSHRQPARQNILHPEQNPYEKVYEGTSLQASRALESNLLGAYRQSIEASSSSRT
ncbi:uncharacterized protein DMAD_04526 [Drosophila madeirensis]|uniref:Uncharacterized protein n=1 Tax=Drosophila madeirensis TaxID=30013 RepID=A0AAU9GB49_DROMD